ncbi:uncharacterized protein LOC130908466 [Corythoichthys intestinalis]|uniref:uncharacterized protein LOC130908466 n=1 Tax=Corythoichthys intestinalis TaxID=161448 RepID=UPI0025A545A8|nr:uncharacterized protein LOC130908466 [Corythoichthys intestinalis]
MLHLAQLVCSIASQFQIQILKHQKWKKRAKALEEHAMPTMDVFWNQQQLFNSFVAPNNCFTKSIKNDDDMSKEGSERQRRVKMECAAKDFKEKKAKEREERKKERKEYDRREKEKREHEEKKERRKKREEYENSQEGRERVRERKEDAREETRKPSKTSVKRQRQMTDHSISMT